MDKMKLLKKMQKNPNNKIWMKFSDHLKRIRKTRMIKIRKFKSQIKLYNNQLK